MKDRTYSGKFIVRIDSKLHERLCSVASRENVSLNQKCIELLSQVDTNSKCTDDDVLRIRASVNQMFNNSLIGIVLFGSTARGESRTTSDIDLLIVIENSINLNRSLYRKWDEFIAPHLADNITPHFVHIAPQSAQVGSLWLEVSLDGVVLFETEKLISNCLRRIRQNIADGHYTREINNGHPYWVRA